MAQFSSIDTRGSACLGLARSWLPEEWEYRVAPSAPGSLSLLQRCSPVFVHSSNLRNHRPFFLGEDRMGVRSHKWTLTATSLVLALWCAVVQIVLMVRTFVFSHKAVPSAITSFSIVLSKQLTDAGSPIFLRVIIRYMEILNIANISSHILFY